MMQVSHNFKRTFRIDKVFPPRDFIKPEFPKRPIYLEIGAGKGKHALLFVDANNDTHLFAIERTKEKFAAFKKVANAKSFSNLTEVHADAIAWSVHALPPKSLSGVFILYPNPERNNANQRWLNMPFFEFLLSRLKDNGRIVLASNIENYIDEAYAQAKEVWKLNVTRSDVPKNSQRTHFEIKYLARGEPCWQLDMIKPADYQTNFDV